MNKIVDNSDLRRRPRHSRKAIVDADARGEIESLHGLTEGQEVRVRLAQPWAGR